MYIYINIYIYIYIYTHTHTTTTTHWNYMFDANHKYYWVILWSRIVYNGHYIIWDHVLDIICNNSILLVCWTHHPRTQLKWAALPYGLEQMVIMPLFIFNLCVYLAWIYITIISSYTFCNIICTFCCEDLIYWLVVMQ